MTDLISFLNVLVVVHIFCLRSLSMESKQRLIKMKNNVMGNLSQLH